MQLQDRIVIATAGAGVDGAILRVLVRRGAEVITVDIDAKAEAELGSELGTDVAFVQGDVGLQETADLAVRTAVERFGALTGLVNNAHASRQAPLSSSPNRCGSCRSQPGSSPPAISCSPPIRTWWVLVDRS